MVDGKAKREHNIIHVLTQAHRAKLQREAAAKPGQEETPDEKAASAERNLVAACLRKRKMYKHTDTMLPWFPHDKELLKLLVHESGRPRWVIFGTPAGGAGIHGCLEMGLSVVALCSDDHHRDVLNRCMLERAVEAMVSQSTAVFRDDSLRTWSVQLNLAKEDEAAKGDDDDPPKETKKDKKEGLLQEEGLQEGQGGPQAGQGELQQQRVQREEGLGMDRRKVLLNQLAAASLVYWP